MTIYNKEIVNYLTHIAPKEDEILLEIHAQAKEMGVPSMSAIEGNFLAIVAKAIKAKRILELGTGLGYSTVYFAKSLPADGRIFTVEREPKYVAQASANFKKASLHDKIEIVQNETTPFLEKIDDKFDLILMDQFKAFYFTDLDNCIKLLNKGGLLLVHNALEGGWLDAEVSIESLTLKKFTKLFLENIELESIILPMMEGFFLGVKK